MTLQQHSAFLRCLSRVLGRPVATEEATSAVLSARLETSDQNETRIVGDEPLVTSGTVIFTFWLPAGETREVSIDLPPAKNAGKES